jgi:hypothetical protein
MAGVVHALERCCTHSVIPFSIKRDRAIPFLSKKMFSWNGWLASRASNRRNYTESKGFQSTMQGDGEGCDTNKGVSLFLARYVRIASFRLLR